MIYCFSGTGNTRRIALELSRSLHTDLHEFSAQELRNPGEVKQESKDEIIIWAFPTYSWGVPPVVRRIIKEGMLDFKADAFHLAVTTCGDDVGNLATMFRKDIEARGLTAGAVFSVQMPNTYVMMKGFDVDSPSLAEKKIAASADRVKFIAENINAGRVGKESSDVVKGAFPLIKTSVIYPWFVRHSMNPKYFHVDDGKCVSCGRCAKACPMDNISYDESGRPVWGKECAFCTACYHVCPAHAVQWRKATLGKGRKTIL